MKLPRPYWRKQRQEWAVEIGGRRYSLGNDKEKAFEKYKELLQGKGLQDGKQVLLNSLIDDFWEYFRLNRAPSTVDTRRAILQSFRDYFPDNTLAEDVRPYHVNKWIKTTGAESPSTICSRIGFANSIFRWGKLYGYLDRNPIEGMPKPKPRVRQDYLKPSQWDTVLQAAANKEQRDMIRFMLETGARPQELVKLRHEHFDEEAEVFTFDIEDSKGNKTSRVIYLTDMALRIVKRYMRRYPEGPILRTSTGHAWNKNSVGSAMKAIRRKLKLPALNATMLRHSFCHYRLTQGQDPTVVAKLMGHVDTTMIMQRYGHLDGSKFLKDKINEVPFPNRKKKKNDDEAA